MSHLYMSCSVPPDYEDTVCGSKIMKREYLIYILENLKVFMSINKVIVGVICCCHTVNSNPRACLCMSEDIQQESDAEMLMRCKASDVGP